MRLAGRRWCGYRSVDAHRPTSGPASVRGRSPSRTTDTVQKVWGTSPWAWWTVKAWTTPVPWWVHPGLTRLAVPPSPVSPHTHMRGYMRASHPSVAVRPKSADGRVFRYLCLRPPQRRRLGASPPRPLAWLGKGRCYISQSQLSLRYGSCLPQAIGNPKQYPCFDLVAERLVRQVTITSTSTM